MEPTKGPGRGITHLGLEKEIWSLSMDKVRRWLRVGVNICRHKSSRSMQTNRPNTFSIPSPPVSFPVWCVLESHNSFSLSADLRGPESEGWSSFPAGLRPWFHLSLFIVVLTEVSETNRRVGISRSGSMICKWRVFRSSGGKHDSSYKQSFASGVVWYLWTRLIVAVPRMAPLIVQIWARSGFDEIEGFFGCRNEMGQGLAHRPVIVGVSHDLRGDSWGCVPRSLFWREDLDRDGERGFDYLTFALVSSKAPHEGVGLRVADSHAGNHPEGGFTPFETIRRLLVVIGRRSHSGFEGETFKPERR
ncbi:hypothetical protein Tco_1249500, partial [Tanacetum coccineum]